jgi:hypothetical protein
MKTKILALLAASSGILATLPPSCTPKPGTDGGNPITPGGVVEAGSQVVSGICYLIEGVDPGGAIANVCATIEEILAGSAYVATLRGSPTAKADGACQNLPQTTYCVTSAERYKLVRYITTLRAAHLLLDGGR